MKQTNNAIKFLMAQYRAIFKKAYLSGVASAVVLTAGLAAGAAQAHQLTNASQLPTDADETVSIIGDNGNGINSFNLLHLAGSNDATTDKFNGTLEIDKGSVSGTHTNYIYQDVNITGTGKLHIKTETFKDSDNNKLGLVIAGASGSGSTVNIGEIDVQQGTLHITDSGHILSNASVISDVTVAANKISVGGGNHYGLIELVAKGTYSSQTKVTLGREADATKNLVASEITVKQDGVLSLTSTDTTDSGTVTIKGQSLNVQEGGLLFVAAGKHNYIETTNYTVDAGGFKVIKSGASLTYKGHQGDQDGSNSLGASGTIAGNMLIESGGSFVVSAHYAENGSGDKIVHEYLNGNKYGWDTVEITDNSKSFSATFGDTLGSLTIKQGANVQIGGQLNVEKGNLFIEDGAHIHATEAANDSNSGSIVVGRPYTTTVSLNERPTLNISAGSLKNFLTAGDEYNEIVLKNEKYEVDNDNPKQDLAGALILHSRGALNFTDQSQVNLNEFVFKSGSASDSGSKALSGTITINADATGAKDTMISGHDLLVGKALKNESNNNTFTHPLGLQLNAEKLTLGDGTADGLKQMSGAGFKRFRVSDSLVLNVENDGYFTLDTDTYNELFNNKPDQISTVDGNTAIDTSSISGGSADALLKIRGNWDIDGNIKFDTNAAAKAGGVISIGYINPTENNTPQEAFANNDHKGYDTNVTLRGDLVNNLSGSNSYGQILIKDYLWYKDSKSAVHEYESNHYANLDITNARLTGSGDGVLHIYTDINGSLTMTGSQLKDVITGDAGRFALTARENGVIYANSSIIGEQNFDRFITAPKPGVSGDQFDYRVSFTSGGTLDINGELSLYTGDSSDSSVQSKSLDFGTGTIRADIVRLTNYHVSGTGANEKPVDVSFKSGTLEVSEGLEVKKSQKLVLGDSSSSGANLDLNTISIDRDGVLTERSAGGYLRFSDTKEGGIIELTSDSGIRVQTGKWTTDADIIANGSGGLTLGIDNSDFNQAQKNAANDYIKNAVDKGEFVAEFIGDHFGTAKSLGSNTTVLTLDDYTKATFNTMQLASGAVVNVNEGATLVLNGREIKDVVDASKNADPADDYNMVSGSSTTAGIALNGATINVTGAGANLVFEKLATDYLLDRDGDSQDTNGDKSKYLLTKDGINNTKFNVDQWGQLTLTFADNEAVSVDDIRYLIGSLGVGHSNDDGILNLANADLGLNIVDHETAKGFYKISWADLKDFINVTGGNVTQDKLKKSLVYGITGDRVRGHFGALSVDTSVGGTNIVNVNGPTSLHNAEAFGGKFIFNQANGEAIGVKLEDTGSLWLENGGMIGSIEGTGSYNNPGLRNELRISTTEGNTNLTTVSGSLTNLDDVYVESSTLVNGKVDVNNLVLSSDMTVALDTGALVNVNELSIAPTGSLTTSDFKLGKAVQLNSGSSDDGLVMGQLTASNSLTVDNSSMLVADGTVKTKDLTLLSGSIISVGYEKNSLDTVDDPSTEHFNELASYSGYLEATGATTLNGGFLTVDPEYGKDTSFIALNNLSGASTTTPMHAGSLDGAAYVGRNAVLGIGVDSLETLKEKVQPFMHGNTLVKEDVGAILYLGKSLVLKGDNNGLSGLTLTADSYEDFITYFDANNGDQNFKGDFGKLSPNNEPDPVKANTIFLGANTGIVIDAKVLNEHKYVDTNTKGVIDFAPGQSGTKGSLIADGGQIYIDGNVRANKYQVFSNADITYIDGTTYRPVDPATNLPVLNEDKDILVSTENKFLVGYVESDGSVDLDINKNGRAIMSGASNPVYEALEDYVYGFTGDTLLADGSNALFGGYDASGNRIEEYSNLFLEKTISLGDGSAAETVARLGVYGGTAQVALAAGNTTTEAISGRMGMGMNTALTQADNGQGAGMWVSPIYRSSDSDGFGAEGVNYGVDVDIYGVALGGDFTMANGLRVGAMFNVGSGSADGKDAGANVSNDFNYYGFGAYVGYTMNQFSVMGDISYTVADNDVDSNTSIEKVNTSLDSTNLSLGVTGQYTLSLGNDLTVVPHAGLRFSKIDLDNYTVKGSADVAHFSAESLNVFSVPVGVTLAKDYVGEEWTVKPSLDITLTGNFGDDSLDGDVKWTGVENLVTKTSSEVLDSFTYGATAGFSAKNGNFSMGLGVSYTGSSNTDEFGLNANARFLF